MKKGQFSRDWSLLKLARTWEPRDIGGEVIERVMAEGSPEAVMDILRVIGSIGFEDGERACERMPPFMEPAEVIESTLMVAGVEMTREDGLNGSAGADVSGGSGGSDGAVLLVNLDAHALFSYPFTMAEPAAAYITGYVHAVEEGAAVVRDGNILHIRL